MNAYLITIMVLSVALFVCLGFMYKQYGENEQFRNKIKSIEDGVKDKIDDLRK